VGRIDAVGKGVSTWAVGDRVADLMSVGGNAHFAIRPASGLVAVPELVDAAETAALVMSWTTAHQALFQVAGLGPSQRVLIMGGNGSVGQAAIVLAKRAGAEVFATVGAPHRELVKALGALPLSREGWQSEVKKMGGVDVVLDGVAADGFRSSWAALKKGGRLVGIGTRGARSKGDGLSALFRLLVGFKLRFWQKKRARFYSIGLRRRKNPDAFKADLSHLFSLLAAGEIKPNIQERIALEEVKKGPRAH
jgi:NADPH:quinone reductase-like Zn-dependent oxidoreductase